MTEEAEIKYRTFIHGKVAFEVEEGEVGEKQQQQILRQIANQEGRYYQIWKAAREDKGLEAGVNPSGLATAFIAGLTNEPEFERAFLAKRRGVPEANYFVDDKTGDLMFTDFEGQFGNRGATYKEYDNILEWGDIDADDITGWMPAASQIAWEIVVPVATTGPAIAAGTPNPAAMIGLGMSVGAASSAAATASANAAREGLFTALGGEGYTPWEQDVWWSAGIGALPIGMPPGTWKSLFKQRGNRPVHNVGYLREKFPSGKDQEYIQAILTEGGGDVDKTIEVARKYGIFLTRGEAQRGIGKAAAAQRVLGRGSHAHKLTEMYLERDERVKELVADFGEELLSGKYMPTVYPRQAPREPVEGSIAELDVARAANKFLEELKKKRQEQTAPLYREAYALDEGGSPELAAIVDQFLTSPGIPGTAYDGSPLPGIIQRLSDPDLPDLDRASYKELFSALTSKKRLQASQANRPPDEAAGDMEAMLPEGATLGEYLPIDTSREVADVIVERLDRLISKHQKGGDNQSKRLVTEFTQIKNSLSHALEAHNPQWRAARDIFREESADLDYIADVKLISDIARIANGPGGAEATRAVMQMFSGTARAIDVKKLKEAVQSTDPEAWQRLKGHWLTSTLENIAAKSESQLGDSRRFLRQLGLAGASVPRKMRGSTDDLVGERLKIYAEIFEPEEMQRFADIVGILQSVASIQGRIGSETFSNIDVSRAFGEESKKYMRGASELAINAVALLAKPITGIRDTLLGETGTRMRQARESAYEDILIQHILSPDPDGARKQLFMDARNWWASFAKTMLREGREALSGPEDESIQRELSRDTPTMDRRPAAPEDLVGAINAPMPSFDPLPPSAGRLPPKGPISSAVLPRVEDREMAQAMRGGIGGLV